jgi:hypothetical protein
MTAGERDTDNLSRPADVKLPGDGYSSGTESRNELEEQEYPLDESQY